MEEISILLRRQLEKQRKHALVRVIDLLRMTIDIYDREFADIYEITHLETEKMYDYEIREIQNSLHDVYMKIKEMEKKESLP